VPVTTGLAFVGGTVAGSTAGAALDRWSNGETLLRPVRSRCDACHVPLRTRDLVPVVSWLVLRGRCASCRAPIAGHLPVLELLSGLVVVVMVHVHGVGWSAALLAIGAVVVVLASLTDIRTLRIPDRLTGSFALVSLSGMVAIDPQPTSVLRVAIWGLGVPGALALLSAATVRLGGARPIGGGDIKLLVGVLVLLSATPGAPLVMAVVAVVSGGCVAAAGLVTGRLQRGDRMPFAPAIAFGYLVAAALPETSDVLVALLTVGGEGGVR